MSDSIWGYQPTTGHTAGTDLTGFKVEATDGSIGKVDKHSDDVDSSYLVVDTGVWIFGKHVLLPAGTVQSVAKNVQSKSNVDPSKIRGTGGVPAPLPRHEAKPVVAPCFGRLRLDSVSPYPVRSSPHKGGSHIRRKSG